MKQKRKIFKTLIYLFLIIFFYFSVFVSKRFDNISFEQLLYNILFVKGANFDIVFEGINFLIKKIFITLLIIYIIYGIYKLLKIELNINAKIRSKNFKIDIFKRTKLKSNIILFIITILVFLKSLSLLNVGEYILNQNTQSNLFEKYYVNGKDIELKFPKKKRNLIYIFSESMESTNVSIENGGLNKESYIPKLEKLALENINFSNTNKIGGALQVNNTEWTIAALIAQTSGTPMKISVDKNLFKNNIVELKGAYTLGDILKDNGYNNYFMIGSDSEFGGRDKYFKNHGNYTIYDYYSAIDKKLIDDDYFVWWGYEDNKLFEYAKEKIIDASKEDEPFNFTILTVDTHFTDGYMDKSCENIFDSKYANSLYCSDSKIYSFIKWIKKQDFYKDTTIIISGDHLTLQDNFYEENTDYNRTTYNAFINTPIKPINEKNRQFSTFDMFPTTLASLGVKIEGNRLGLGVNLFSKEETLIEKLGYNKFNKEISKKSKYYDKKISNK